MTAERLQMPGDERVGQALAAGLSEGRHHCHVASPCKKLWSVQHTAPGQGPA